jgi:hypothetical protein
MPTPLQVAANGRNGRKSTGPKSRAGKSRAARNARRHGLATSIWCDPTLASATEALARELAGPGASPELQGIAREAAAAHIAVDRVRRARHWMIVQQLEDPILLPTNPRAAWRQVKDLIELDELQLQRLYVPWRLRFVAKIPDGVEKYALVVSNLARKLAVTERYERRCVSRRKWAFRKLVAEQRKCKGISDMGKSDETGSGVKP